MTSLSFPGGGHRGNLRADAPDRPEPRDYPNWEEYERALGRWRFENWDPQGSGSTNAPDPGAPSGDRSSDPSNRLADVYPDAWGRIDQLLGGLRGGGAPGEIWADLAGSLTTDTDVERFLQSVAPFIAASMQGTDEYKDVVNWQPRVDEWAQQYGGAPNLMGQYGGIAGQMGQAGTQAQSAGMNRLAQSGMGRSGQMAALASQVAQQTGSQQAGAYGQLSTQQSLANTQHQQSFANRMLSNRMAGTSNAMDAMRVINQLALGHNVQPRTWIDQGNDDSALWAQLGQAGGQAVVAMA